MKHTGLLVGELRGYRAWRLTTKCQVPGQQDNVRLRSVFQQVDRFWVPGVQELATHYGYRGVYNKQSQGLIHNGATPEATNCKCGYNAYYEVTTLARDTYVSASGVVWGAVRGIGQAWLHETGFRSSRMEILAVCPSASYLVNYHPSTDLLEETAEMYGVPFYPSIEELTQDYPPHTQEEEN